MKSSHPRAAATFAVIVAIIAGACRETSSPEPVRDYLRLSKDSVTATANEKAIVTLTAETNPRLHPAGTPVVFTASGGTLLPNGTAPTDSTGHARIQLRAPKDAMLSRITAVVGNLIVFDSVAFVTRP